MNNRSQSGKSSPRSIKSRFTSLASRARTSGSEQSTWRELVLSSRKVAEHYDCDANSEVPEGVLDQWRQRHRDFVAAKSKSKGGAAGGGSQSFTLGDVDNPSNARSMTEFLTRFNPERVPTLDDMITEAAKSDRYTGIENFLKKHEAAVRQPEVGRPEGESVGDHDARVLGSDTVSDLLF